MQIENQNNIYIIKYGVGNVGSIYNMLKKLGINSKIVDDPNQFKNPAKIILPGVGAFDNGISSLKRSGFFDLIKEAVLNNKVPILGICLGMQMLTNGSEEGSLEGLSFIDSYCKRFQNSNLEKKLKIPHMGWNFVYPKTYNILFEKLPNDMRFYFVHSYFPVCKSKENIIATTKNGDEFVSVIGKGNIFGTQFHPEKSHKFGMQLLKNFANFQ